MNIRTGSVAPIRRLLPCIALGLACVCPAHWVRAQDAGDRQAGGRLGTSLNEAAILLSEGNANAALAKLDDLSEQEPENPWIWYLRGLALRDLHRTREAVDSFSRAADALSRDPEANPALVDTVALAARQARRRLLTIEWEFGPVYDTNVTFLGEIATGTDLITNRSDARLAQQFGVRGLVYEDAKTTLSFRLDTSHTWHEDIHTFDFQSYGGGLALIRQPTPVLDLEVTYDYGFSLLGRDGFASLHTLTAGMTRHWHSESQWLKPTSTTVYYAFQDRDFQFDTTQALDRDGQGQYAGIDQRWELRVIDGPLGAWKLLTSYRFGDIATEGTEFDRQEQRFAAGITVPVVNPSDTNRYLFSARLPTVFRFQAEWVVDRYRHRSGLANRRRTRHDLISTFEASLAQTVVDDPKLGTVVVKLAASYSDADSSFRTGRPATAPFSYDKAVYGLQIRWTW